MEEFKLPEKINKFNITQEQYDELMKKLRILSFQQQEAQDTLEGGITSRNLASFRNTYVINAQDSLDASYPMYVHFNIINEMIKIVSVKVSFWILNYRAYSKAGAAAGTPSGGGSTTPSGGGATSGVSGGTTYTELESQYSVGQLESKYVYPMFANRVTDLPSAPYAEDVEAVQRNVKRVQHKHYMGNHSHSTPDHTHSTPDHTHPDHTHDAVYGIFEEETSPTIKFYISENEGVSYNDTFFGGYDVNKKDLEITSLLAGAGSKLIKFTSTARARLSVQIEIKVDIKAR